MSKIDKVFQVFELHHFWIQKYGLMLHGKLCRGTLSKYHWYKVAIRMVVCSKICICAINTPVAVSGIRVQCSIGGTTSISGLDRG